MTELATSAPPRAELLLRAYARAKARYAPELGTRRLVFPDARDFPDTFSHDEAGARRLLQRMQAHAGMSDIPVAVRVLGADDATASSCTSGACAVPSAPSSQNLTRVADEGNGWVISLKELELKHPIFLTTELARALALVFLIETEEPGDPEPSPFLVELMATMLGFGGLLLQGSYVYQKACSGPRIDQLTSLNVSETGLLCALMALDSGSGLGRLPSLMEATQKAALNEALDLLRGHSKFMSRLANNPLLAATATLEAEAPPSLLGKLKARLLPRSHVDLPGEDETAWQRVLEESAQPPNRPMRALPSQDLRDLVKSEL